MKLIKPDIYYVGVNDHQLDLFEGQYVVPNGMAYNSYVIKDELIAVFDSVEKNFKDEWLKNLKEVLGDEQPTYLIVQHMEPDHSGNIMEFLKVYPNAFVIATAQAFKMMSQFFKEEIKHKIVVADGDTLNLGKHTLKFIAAPMVHWPEVMVTYDEVSKTLFSADAFGKFGALDHEEDWACEARRYYFGIVGKYGVQVQNLLKKGENFELETICPLHGPILNENLSYYLNLYDTWSSYQSETDGVAIFYTSVYGHTKEAAKLLADTLQNKGCSKVVFCDLAREDMAEAVEDAFRYPKIVFATTTYNMSIFPFMKTFLDHLIEHNFQNKTVGLIENGTWAPNASKVMKEMLGHAKNVKVLETEVCLMSALSEENKKQIELLAAELMKPSEHLAKEKEVKKIVKKHHFACKICGFVIETENEELPKDYVCPICKHPASDFEKLD
jgi:flavorubredoxin/rubredoxin